MPSDKSTVATKADFVPTVVGGTDRERSIASSAPRAHDGTSQRHRPEVHQTQFNVLTTVLLHITSQVITSPVSAQQSVLLCGHPGQATHLLASGTSAMPAA